MEPESSSPYPQVPATRPYPEPTPSSPHDPLQLPEPYHLHVPIVFKSVCLNLLEPSGPVQACNGIYFLFSPSQF